MVVLFIGTTFDLQLTRTMAKDIKKVQSKIETDLLDHVEKQNDYKSMNSYIKTALIEKSKFKRKKS